MESSSELWYKPPYAKANEFDEYPVKHWKKPTIHWLTLLLLSGITSGLFGVVYAFKQARFVWHLYPRSRATDYLVGSIVCLFISSGTIGMERQYGGSGRFAQTAVTVLQAAGLALVVLSSLDIRRSLLRSYNVAEPGGAIRGTILAVVAIHVYAQYLLNRISRSTRKSPIPAGPDELAR